MQIMIDNLYFLFLDEIYSPNLNDMLKLNKEEIFSHPNHKHFGISGVILSVSLLNELNLKSRRIKNRYYPNKNNLIFHYVDILHNRGDFSDLGKDFKKKKAFNESLSSLIENSDFKYTCVFIDKHDFIKKFGSFDESGRLTKIRKIGSNLFPRGPVLDYNLYLLCLKTMLEIFYKFLTSRMIQARGIVINEARGEKEDTELREAFHKININGISSISPTELRSIILDLFIVPKKQNYIGTQLADLLLYPTYDGTVPFHGVRNDHFIAYERILKRKLLGGIVHIIP